MKQLMILALFSVAFGQPEQILTGYLMQSEVSFCMDECGEYYIDTFGDMYWPVVFNSNIDNIDLYIDRYVEVWIDQEITCVECNAYEIISIALSDDCLNPVNCIADPCLVAEECQINTPTECVANYCGGCYADFYDLNGNLVNCNLPVEECIPPYIEIEGYCFHQDDISVLEDMIHNSINSGMEDSPNPYMDGENWHEVIINGEFHQFSNSNGIVEPLELGLQEWEDGRLTSLMCGAYIYCDLSGEIPTSISNLSEINVLRLEVNYFSGYVPESICELEQLNYNDYLDFDLSHNQLCPPYPDCIPENALSYMEPSHCYTLGDINDDFEVNVLDIVLIVNFILITDEATDTEFSAGDFNSDGQLNVLDVVGIIQMILNPLPEACYLEPDPGFCDAAITKYYYNSQSEQCDMFLWGGCDGVVPFESLEECENACE